MLLALLLRLWDSADRSLWFDEAFEYLSSQVDLGQINAMVLKSFQPPLYSYVLHAWLQLGSSELWLRLLSALLSVMGVAGVMLLGRRLIGPAGGLLAGLILAGLPGDIRYAQEVAEYAMVVCLIIWSLVCLERAVGTNLWRWWWSWALVGGLAVYTHYGAGIIVISSGLAVFAARLWGRQWGALGRQVGVTAALALACLPLAWFFLREQLKLLAAETSAGQVWPPIWRSPAETFGFALSGWPGEVRAIWPTICVLGLAAGILLLTRSQIKPALRRFLIWFAAAYALYELSVRAGVYAHGLFGGRYSLILSPFLVLVIAAALVNLARAWRPALAVAPLLALLALFVWSSPILAVSRLVHDRAMWNSNESMRELMADWHRHADPSQPIYVYYGATPAFRYYLQRLAERDQRWMCARPSAAQPCPLISFGDWLRGMPPEAKEASIETSLGAWPASLWVVFSHVYPGENREVLELLSRRYEVQTELHADSSSAYLLMSR
jgi:mannosyltransferase